VFEEKKCNEGNFECRKVEEASYACGLYNVATMEVSGACLCLPAFGRHSI
jgi:hypothetical protein